MKIKTADEAYLEQAKALSEQDSERVLSRMSGKLPRRREKDKLSTLEAIAIQLELEDEQLKDWRERMQTLKENGKK